MSSSSVLCLQPHIQAVGLAAELNFAKSVICHRKLPGIQNDKPLQTAQLRCTLLHDSCWRNAHISSPLDLAFKPTALIVSK